MKKPLILVTNDDGITAPGIRNLISVMNELGRVVVVAPDKPQSGMGHAITINATLRVNKIKSDGPQQEYSCTGTPVDCVKVAINEVLKEKPALIVSGINHGSNSSVNVIYSGTMSAAVEGALENIPSIGFSLCNFSIEADFSPALKYVKSIAEKVLEKGLPARTCLNVNFPSVPAEMIQGVRICRQALGYWEEELDKRTDPSGKEYFWLTGKFKNLDNAEDTDEWALANNYVSVVPVLTDFTAHSAIEHLKSIHLNK
ncbi:MAG: 5'/3'-nucleotidase SurE [Bacteroidota bacterium]